MYEKLEKYVDDGLLSVKADEKGHAIVCYTKQCFFGKDTWDEVTKTHRGALYYDGVQRNKPFEKIFNVGEVNETNSVLIEERMANEDYEVYDKANGHLFIMSAFQDDGGEQHVVFSTKGSLPHPGNDLLNDDILIFSSKYAEKLDAFVNMFPNSTLMFESIVSHDKHTMYDEQVEQYGEENTFVLLGVSVMVGDPVCQNWTDAHYDTMAQIAGFIGCPVVKRYDEVLGTPEMWKQHKGIEGYVIRFLSDDFRVKVKTDEYWVARFKKDLTPERILQVYRGGGEDRLRLRLPEEIVEEVIVILDDLMKTWFHYEYVRVQDIEPEVIDKATRLGLDGERRRELFSSEKYSMEQKQYIAGIADRREPFHKVKSSISLRNQFLDFALSSDSVMDDLAAKLNETFTSL